jgi:aspartokinase/homoserine dehydrogenase 1
MMGDWLVFKFGGTSMGSAERIRGVAEIVVHEIFDRQGERHRAERLAVVVSAMSGVTDSLLALIRLAIERSPELSQKLDELRVKHLSTARALLNEASAAAVATKIQDDLQALSDVLKGVSLMRECSDRTRDFVSGLGEVWSATILSEYLKNQNYAADFVDARTVLVVEPEIPSPTILWEESEKAFAEWRRCDRDFLVVTGFVCRTRNDVPATLGRNGSDYSAAIFGALLDAREVVIWTDVDGVMSADPRRVSDAIVVPELSYREAIELAYFGAKVLHPMTMVPAVTKGIPIRIKNTFNPGHPGSLIQSETMRGETLPVKGCTTIDDVALVEIEVTGMQSLAAVAARAFGIMNEEKIRVILGTLGSPGNCIAFAVPKTEAESARLLLEKIFAVELQLGDLEPLRIRTGNAILAIVGDGMGARIGMASRFFEALGKAGVNVRAIAQGPEERNISVVVNTAEANKALRAAHAGFYLSPQTLSLGVIGTDKLGRALLAQIEAMRSVLREMNVDLRLRGIFGCETMVLSDKGIALGQWETELSSRGTASDVAAFVEHLASPSLPHAVIIDCSSRSDLAELYPQWIERGLHLVTQNRVANASGLTLYHKLQSLMRERGRHYLYESTVCGALPVVETLADLVQTGDTVASVEGLFSGLLARLLGRIEEGIPLSAAVHELLEAGADVAELVRELRGDETRDAITILAREMGHDVEVGDVKVEPLIPLGAVPGDAAELARKLLSHDADLARRVREAADKHSVLRYLGIVDEKGIVSVGLKMVSRNHPFALVRSGDNAVAFYTMRFGDRPLVVQGPAAGVEVLAAGLFADLLRLTRYLGSMG